VNLLAPVEVAELQDWLDDVRRWPAGSHVWGHYAEATAGGPVVSRTENVSACHPGVAALVEGRLRELATELLGEPAVAFKDKVNYKQPGGAGFSPHQDLAAYPGVGRVVSLLVAVDECSEVSGCLWLAPPAEGVLPTDDRGVLLESVTRDLHWSPAVLGAGDVAVIDGLAPHHSEANRSDRPRRVLIASYAPAAEGYDRMTYYGARREVMDAVGEPRISTLGDFEGTHVLPDEIAEVHCTH